MERYAERGSPCLVPHSNEVPCGVAIVHHTVLYISKSCSNPENELKPEAKGLEISKYKRVFN